MTIKLRKATTPPLERRAALGSVDLERRTVELVWTTGAKVLRSNWLDGAFYEELSVDPAHVRLDRLNSGAPFLANHDGYDVARQLGVVESARLAGGEGHAVVRFARAEDDPEADKVFRKIVDKIIRNVSVGYRIWKAEKIESADGTVPTIRAIDWEPYEISAVSMGADAGAGFRAATAESNEVEITTPNQEQNVFKKRKLQQQNEGNGGGGSPAPVVVPPPAPDLSAVRNEAARLERERSAGIRHAVRSAKLDDKVADDMIAQGVSLDEARKTVLEQLAQRTEATPIDSKITGGETAGEKWERGALAWLLTRTGDVAVRAKAANVEAFKAIDLDPGESRGLSLFDLAREYLERNGVKTRGMDRMTLVGRAFTTRSGGVYSGTSDFPTLLENAMGKILLGAYAITPDTWSRFCKVDTVPDFRASPRYRTGSLSVLDALGENSEFKNKSIPDGSKQSISVGTKGNIIGISRQLVINDDMGALTDLMSKLGRAARLTIEKDVYALLTANSGLGATFGANPFFHSSNGNVNATGSALSVAGIDADRVVMAGLMDSQSNEYLDLRPSILLLPVGLGGAARVINTSVYDHDGTKLQRPNPVQGLFRDVIDTPRLSGTRRYLFADPAVAPAIVVAFLEGQGQSPVIETENGWRVDGAEMKIRFDFAAQFFDPKGALTNAGV